MTASVVYQSRSGTQSLLTTGDFRKQTVGYYRGLNVLGSTLEFTGYISVTNFEKCVCLSADNYVCQQTG